LYSVFSSSVIFQNGFGFFIFFHFRESIELSLIKYDSFGQVYARFDDLASLTKDNYLYSFRIQLHHVKKYAFFWLKEEIALVEMMKI
jgi:hypothetical protein